METETLTFGAVRQWNLDYWLSLTKGIRKPNEFNDDFTKSFECDWQEKCTNPEMHNSIYCSLAEWSMHITDWLSDTFYDSLQYNYTDQRAALFRHYTRLNLVVSEILIDLSDLVERLEPEQHGKRTISMAKKKDESTVEQLLLHINTIHKHKLGNGRTHTGRDYLRLHKRNHHSAYCFIDNDEDHTDKTILIHPVKELIFTIYHAYTEVNQILPKAFHRLKEYEAPDAELFPEKTEA